MCATEDLYAFIGLLNLAYTDRNQGFVELVEMMKDVSLHIPQRAEKVEVSSMNTYRIHALFITIFIYACARFDVFT